MMIVVDFCLIRNDQISENHIYKKKQELPEGKQLDLI